MKKKYYLLTLLIIILTGCQSEQTHTYMLVRKDTPYPNVRSYYSLWKDEEMEKKKSVINGIDGAMEQSEEVYEAVKNEWMHFSFIDKNDFIEDFLFRRRKSHICKYLGTLPYKRYLDMHIAEDFIEEFQSIMLLSAEVSERIDKEKKAVYAKNKVISEEIKKDKKETGNKEGQPNWMHQKKINATSYYEKAVEKAGLSSSTDEEVFIKDATKKVTE